MRWASRRWGRNALFLTHNGFQVDAVNISATAVAQVREHGAGSGADSRRSGLDGGVGHRAEDLRWIFQDFLEVELCRMTEGPVSSATSGRSFLRTALCGRP